MAGLLELLPWILQWHNQLDPDTDHYMGDFYRLFIEGQAAELGFTLDQVRNWAPEVKPRGRGRKA